MLSANISREFKNSEISTPSIDHLGRLEIHIALSNPNIDVRILAQGFCVLIVYPYFNLNLTLNKMKYARLELKKLVFLSPQVRHSAPYLYWPFVSKVSQLFRVWKWVKHNKYGTIRWLNNRLLSLLLSKLMRALSWWYRNVFHMHMGMRQSSEQSKSQNVSQSST